MSLYFDSGRLAYLVKAHRGDRSLRDAARESKVSASTLSRVERADTPPDIETFLALCRWLRVDPRFFFCSENEPPHVTPEEIGLLLEELVSPTVATALVVLIRHFQQSPQ